MAKEIRSDDRILVIKQVPGQEPLNSSGIVDKRLFTGGNNLHVERNPRDDLWFFRYDCGAVPPVLKHKKFTGFPKAYAFAERYLNGRGLQIIEVKENHAESA